MLGSANQSILLFGLSPLSSCHSSISMLAPTLYRNRRFAQCLETVHQEEIIDKLTVSTERER